MTSERIVRVIDGRRVVTDRATSERMAGIRQKDTAPEFAVRRALAAHGLRFRTHNRDLPGSPDVANRNRKWAVFVHGCYWHRHAGCSKATTPKRNRDFWISKFEANVARDARARAELESLGFDVLVVWECEVATSAFVRALSRFARRHRPD